MSGGSGGGRNNNNVLVVPQANQALQQLKYEVAQELGIAIPQDGYYGYMATRDTGAIGGNMVRRMIQIAEQTLASGMPGMSSTGMSGMSGTSGMSNAGMSSMGTSNFQSQ